MPGLVANAQNPNAGVAVGEDHRTAISTSIDVVDHDGNQIGFIQNINPSENRPVTAVRHLNSQDAGRIIEQTPSPANNTISVTGFALYTKDNDGSLIQRIGGSVTAKAMRTLEEQSIPFNLIVKTTHPATGEVEITTYHDCWLTSHTRPVAINNMMISESANIAVTWVDGTAA